MFLFCFKNKKLANISFSADACGPPPDGAGTISLRHVIMAHRDRYINDDPENRPHWLDEGRRALRRYLKLLCFAVYLRYEGGVGGAVVRGRWIDGR